MLYEKTKQNKRTRNKNRKVFNGESRTLIHFVAFEEQVSCKTVAKSPADGVVQVPILGVDKHARFCGTKKHFISE